MFRAPRCFAASPLASLAGFLEPLRESRCVSCAAPVPSSDRNAGCGAPLCPACAAALARRSAGYCPRCGNLFPAPPETISRAGQSQSGIASPGRPAPPVICGDCLASPKPWENFFFHGAYQGLLRDLILRFKNGHELPLGNLLGKILAAHPEITGPYDAIVPMPLHPRRLRERGFNQALQTARPLAARCGSPVRPDCLARVRDTRPQAGLSLQERKANVRGIFSAAGVAGMRLLLVDDIATTCASLESAADALLRAGAFSVAVAVIARTPDNAAFPARR